MGPWDDIRLPLNCLSELEDIVIPIPPDPGAGALCRDCIMMVLAPMAPIDPIDPIAPMAPIDPMPTPAMDGKSLPSNEDIDTGTDCCCCCSCCCWRVVPCDWNDWLGAYEGPPTPCTG